MATKKTTSKKTTAKATAKKTSTKEVTAIKTNLKTTNVKTPRRPATNPSMPNSDIVEIGQLFNQIRDLLNEYAAHLRPLDRKRLNGVGIKKQGFIERTFEYALDNEYFLPQYLPIEKFSQDRDYFVNLRLTYDICTQIRELIWNVTLQAADVTYTDALDFYAAVREAAKRRIDGAETIWRDLEKFFPRKKHVTEEPTIKQQKKDFNAYLHHKRDGKLVIENINPKLTGGVHKVIDEHFTNSDRFKETIEGDIEE